MSDDVKEKKSVEAPSKEVYVRPQIVSEPWLVNGAAVTCNGSVLGGRKESLGAPNFCRANRLLS